MNRSIKDGLVLGTTLLVIHSFASFLVFLYCHVDDDSQAVFIYFLFFVVDAPTVPLAFEIEGKIGLLAGLTDAWTDLWYHGHQGVNLRVRRSSLVCNRESVEFRVRLDSATAYSTTGTRLFMTAACCLSQIAYRPPA